jgi:LysM domain
MHHYVVQQGDSPHSIAHRFGIHVWQLIEANPNKPVVTVSGQQTWSALYPGERLRVPAHHHHRGFVAPPSPPPQQPWWQPQQPWQPPLPQQWQQQQVPQRPYHPGRFRFGPIHGIGSPDARARWFAHEELLRRIHGRHGYEYGDNPYGVAGAGVGDVAGDALNALLAAGDPCDPNNAALVCAVQTALGIGADGKWGAGTAKAAQAVVPGAPGACTPRPSWWAPAGQSNCGGAPPMQMPPLVVTPAPAPAPVPAPPPATVPATTAPSSLPPAPPPAVLAMTTLDPCAAANVSAVCAAQAALGIGVDGKWGAGTAKAAQAVLSNAPPACAPRPGWWAPAGQSNCGGGATPGPAPKPRGGGGAPGPVPGPGAGPGVPPMAPLQASVTPGGIAPPKGGASTMAVASVLGLVAIAGIVAVVATGAHKPIITRYRTRRAPAAPAPAPAPHHRTPAHARGHARRGLSRRPKKR